MTTPTVNTGKKYIELPEYITPNFTGKEVLFSYSAERAGIKNRFYDPAILQAIVNTAKNMESVREVLDDSPITVKSWYRSPTVNKLVGSKNSNSQHTKGEAVDFDADDYGTPLDICKRIIESGITFDQLILEHSWVHISFKSPSSKNRKQVLSLLANGKYATGLTNKSGKTYK